MNETGVWFSVAAVIGIVVIVARAITSQPENELKKRGASDGGGDYLPIASDSGDASDSGGDGDGGCD